MTGLYWSYVRCLRSGGAFLRQAPAGGANRSPAQPNISLPSAGGNVDLFSDDSGSSAAKAAPRPDNGYGSGFRWYAVTSLLLVLLGGLAYKTGVDRIDALSDRIDSTRALQRQKMDEMLSSLVVDTVS